MNPAVGLSDILNTLSQPALFKLAHDKTSREVSWHFGLPWNLSSFVVQVETCLFALRVRGALGGVGGSSGTRGWSGMFA